MAKYLSLTGLTTLMTKIKAMFVRTDASTTLSSGFGMSGASLTVATSGAKGLFYYGYTCTATASTSKSGYVKLNISTGTPALELQAVNRSTGTTYGITLAPYPSQQLYITGGDGTKVLMGDGKPKALSDLMADYETRIKDLEDTLQGAGLM